MEWERLSLKEMSDFVNKMNSDVVFYNDNIDSIKNPNPPEPYSHIHDILKKTYDSYNARQFRKSKDARSREYGLDLEMAGAIFRIFHEYNLTVKDASDNEIWMYINRYVMSDIILDRYEVKGDENKLNVDRFYYNSRRFYPKMLWWYIYLSWQTTGKGFVEDLDSTLILLKNNMSDDISQLIERAGEGGYSVDIYREIMKQYSMKTNDGIFVDNLLRNVLKLNIVRMENTEPELSEDGLSAYVSELFEEVLAYEPIDK